MIERQVFYHPQSKVPIAGRRLQKGDVLERDDVYPSLDGKWRKCPTVGLELRSERVLWIRP